MQQVQLLFVMSAVWAYLQLVIEAQLDIRHATQEHLHDNLAIHITSQHGALVAHQHVDLHTHSIAKATWQYLASVNRHRVHFSNRLMTMQAIT